MNAKVILVLISILILGCAKKPEPINVIQTPEPRTVLNLQEPPTLILNSVKFKVITPNNQEKVFDDLKQEGTDEILFGLTDDNYKNLALNIAKIKAYLIEQQTIINSYKKYYEGE